ncbi:MAG: PEP/pyruvate-binding domain-containing protein [Promethearchaeota archaeon]
MTINTKIEGSKMGKTYIKWFKDIGKEDTHIVGGKCANLGELMKIGIPIPDGFAITTDAYISFIKETRIEEEINSLLEKAQEDLSDLNNVNKISDQISEIIQQAEFPDDIREVIISAFKKTIEETESIDSVAIRSSGVQEDMDTASFAGQYETELNIKGEEEFLEAVKKCWSSLFGSRLIEYRAKMNIGYDQAEMAVGVQQMLNPLYAGIMFTLNPATGNTNQIMIEATWGQGESIVSGSVIPDIILLKKNTLSIEKIKKGSKATCTVVTEEGGVKEEEVDEERRNKFCLTQREAQYLGELGKKIEDHYGTPQDIEWAITERPEFPDNIFILQTRTITSWSQKEEEKKEDERSETAKKLASSFQF